MTRVLRFQFCEKGVSEMTHQRREDGAGFGVVDDESEGSVEVLEDLVGRVRRPVAERPISLDHQHRFVRALRHPVLPYQAAYIVHSSREDTIYLVHATEIPAITNRITVKFERCVIRLSLIFVVFITSGAELFVEGNRREQPNLRSR